MIKKSVLSLALLVALAGCSGEEEGKAGSGNSAVTIGFSKAAFDIREGSAITPVGITIQASRAVDNDVTVRLKTLDGSAIAGADYNAYDGEIKIAKGSRNATVNLNILGNDIHQDNRQFDLELSDLKGERMELKLGTAEAIVKILDDDAAPKVTFATDKVTVHEDIGTVMVQLDLDRLSAKDIKVSFNLSGLASKDVDYRVETTQAVIPALSSTFNYPVRILSDSLVEGTEDITLTMGNIDGGERGETVVTRIFIAGDLRLPDTGVTQYYNNGLYNAASPDSAHPYQDAQYGLDTNPMYDSNGHAGFVYTKIDGAGNPLAANADDHSCVYDNHTGLTWEVKGPTAPPVPENDVERYAYSLAVYNSWQHKYTWYNTDARTNGGQAGGVNDREFGSGDHLISANCVFPSRTTPLYINARSTGCTSTNYVQVVNKAGRCGFSDWRVPSIQELTTLVRYEMGSSLLDNHYFTDAQPDRPTLRYMSSTPAVDNAASYWCVNTATKQTELCHKQNLQSIRLVRGIKL